MTKGTAPSLNVTYNASTNRRTIDCADLNGNIGSVSASCSEGYTFDVSNRITAVGSSKYSYAPNNQRVWRTTPATGAEITYYGASGQKLRTYSLSGTLGLTVTGTYYYFGGKLIKNAGGYITPDRLGSNGKYFPFGQERPSATSNNKEKFATYYRDSETGFDYANNRYHQPGHGRFLTPDPFGGSASTADPGSWNRYSYTGGDPVNRTDSNGLDWMYDFANQEWHSSLDYNDFCWMNVGGCQMMFNSGVFMYDLGQMGFGGVGPNYAMTFSHAFDLNYGTPGFGDATNFGSHIRFNEALDVNSQCEQSFRDLNIDLREVASTNITFLDERESGGRTIGSIVGSNDQRTLSEYVSSAWAAVLPNADGSPSDQVVLSEQYFRDWNDFDYRRQRITVLHETLHVSLGMSDIQLARRLGVYRSDSSASEDISNALEFCYD